MPLASTIQDSAARTESIGPAEASAISLMRNLPENQREEAFEWFKGLAKKKVIRDQILSVLKTYVDDRTKR